MLLVAVLAMAITASLGRWQLSRADQKLGLQRQMQAQMDESVLTERDLEITPALWGEMHRRVSLDRKSTRLNSSHSQQSRMPSSA